MDTPVAKHNSEDYDKEWLVDDWKESYQQISADTERSLFQSQHCMGKCNTNHTLVLLKGYGGKNYYACAVAQYLEAIINIPAVMTLAEN